MKLTLYSKPDCHLCEDTERELRQLQARYPHELEVVDITSDAILLERYGERIPVVQLCGREVAAPLTRNQLERLLSEAG
jgi:glutaredoxin